MFWQFHVLGEMKVFVTWIFGKSKTPYALVALHGVCWGICRVNKIITQQSIPRQMKWNGFQLKCQQLHFNLSVFLGLFVVGFFFGQKYKDFCGNILEPSALAGVHFKCIFWSFWFGRCSYKSYYPGNTDFLLLEKDFPHPSKRLALS